LPTHPIFGKPQPHPRLAFLIFIYVGGFIRKLGVVSILEDVELVTESNSGKTNRWILGGQFVNRGRQPGRHPVYAVLTLGQGHDRVKGSIRPGRRARYCKPFPVPHTVETLPRQIFHAHQPVPAREGPLFDKLRSRESPNDVAIFGKQKIVEEKECLTHISSFKLQYIFL